jgi:hypothetical protein
VALAGLAKGNTKACVNAYVIKIDAGFGLV